MHHFAERVIRHLMISSIGPAQVKFTQDAIDETDVLEEILGPRSEALGGKLTKVVLTGNHLTPVAPVSTQSSEIL